MRCDGLYKSRHLAPLFEGGMPIECPYVESRPHHGRPQLWLAMMGDRVPAGCRYSFETSPNPSARGQSTGEHHSKPVFKPPSTPLDVPLNTLRPAPIRAAPHASG